MQVILFQNTDKLGMQGDVVNVAPGYYRNYLGPRGIALEATAGNLSRLEVKRKKLREQADRMLGEADTVAKQLNAVKLTYTMKVTPDGERLFGSLHDHDIVTRLQEQGFTIERRQIALREPIKTPGTHAVRVKLLGAVEAQVTVVIEPEAATPEKGQPAEAEAPQAAEATPETEAPQAAEATPETEAPPTAE